MARIEKHQPGSFCWIELSTNDQSAAKNFYSSLFGGTLCWADLSTPDQARAAKFYSDLFDWKLTGDTDDDPPSGYLHIQNGEELIGGIPPAAHRDPQTPAHWLPYFLVSNCDASAAKAKQLGAKFTSNR
jgi:predicted enzyme related to lactoylglutathione lyase